ncbi:hypothetical protein HMPREF1635_05495 [Clostridiales bacterium S5-A14a]|nr:hypothetical protein HMPREF1635_05495 [Clostridiales bacterium S5-A14a]
MLKLKKAVIKLTALLFTLATVFCAGGLANVNAETTDITEINLTGNYQYGTVPAGVLPEFNPRTTTDSITIGLGNSGWSYYYGRYWRGFGGETPVAYNDGKTKYGYLFQVKPKEGYQLASSNLKVIYNGEDVTSTAEVSRWPWGAYITVDLGKAIGENPTTYKVTFNSNGGTEIPPKEVVSGLKIKAPSTPTKDKYLFKGWYEDSTFSKKFDFNTPITGNITLYAKWEAANSINEVKLAGDYQYGTVPVGTLPSFNPRTMTDSITIDKRNSEWMYKKENGAWSGFGSNTPVAYNDGKTDYGYIFHVAPNDGYQLASSNLKVIYNGEDVTSTAKVSRWPWGAYVIVDLGKATGENPTTYKVTFDANGGSGTMPAVTKKAGETFVLPDCDFTAPTGKEFKAWEVNGDEKAVGDTITVNASITVKALWKAKTVTPGTDPGTEPGTTPGTDPGTNPGTTPSDNPITNELKVMTEGQNDSSTVAKGNEVIYIVGNSTKAVFRILGEELGVEDLKSVLLDSKLVDASNYDVRKGSIIVSFKKSYVDSLAPGIHEIKFNTTKGVAKAELVVKQKTQTSANIIKTAKAQPNTGDSGMLYVYTLELLMAVGVMIILNDKRKKNNLK